MIRKRKGAKLNPYLLVLLSFLGVILVGATLLCLKWFRNDGKWGNFLNALFVATSATCVTGLSPYANGIAYEFNIYGQIVILVMIQVGGLGFITILTFIISLFKNKLQFKDRYMIAQMVNSNKVADVLAFVRKLIIISAIAEVTGFALGIPVFLKLYPNDAAKALWTSFFTSVSAFNNAGFDTLGSTSLIRDLSDSSILLNNLSDMMYLYFNIYLMVLIITGGISFLVILDVFASKKRPNQYTAFTKIVLTTTATLLIFGSLAFILIECTKKDNPMTILQAIFQSVTCRTAGFATYNQENLTEAGKAISCILMFIGGSPLSTAGGIKTTTIYIIILAIVSYLASRQVVSFKRRYSPTSIVKGMSLLFLGMIIVVVGYMLVAGFEKGNPLATGENIIFELFSAFGTTGLSCNLTPTLTAGSKITLCFLMFAGRLGPFTFFQLFSANNNKDDGKHFEYIEEDFLIG